jgi:hypothetical protein
LASRWKLKIKSVEKKKKRFCVKNLLQQLKEINHRKTGEEMKYLIKH